jgi:hypothetical protein
MNPGKADLSKELSRFRCCLIKPDRCGKIIRDSESFGVRTR